MGFFEKIADLINGNKETATKQPLEDNGPKPSSGNSINTNARLSQGIIAKLKTFYLGQHPSFGGKALTIWITDNLFYNSLTGSNFANELATNINVEMGVSFGKIEIRQAGSQDMQGMTEVIPNAYIQISEIQSGPVIARSATIYSVEGNGSSIEPSYILDSLEIDKLPSKRYNIGAGKNPIMSNNLRRVNHIAIDDNAECPEFSKNKYVSRSHAHISFSETYGFMLNMEVGGSREASKRTHIQRGEELIELTNTLVPMPLKDGDFIVLSKNVHLLFKEN